MPHDQARPQLSQCVIESGDAGMDKFDAAILRGERIKNLLVKNESAKHATALLQRMMQSAWSKLRKSRRNQARDLLN
jgi:hypothetical protein